jgi:predicted O-methyltransferase YrrM
VESDSLEERMVKLVLPDQHTPMLLETAVLLALARLVRPRTFFEFGTFLGIETLNMAANLAPESKVYTLDLDDESLKTVRQAEPDKPLTEIHMKARQRLAFLSSSYSERITQLYGDSNTFDFSGFCDQVDMIYVDGGHDLRTITSDTENSFKMLRPGSPSCIVWHDFENPVHPAVGPYLVELSKSRSLFHVIETMMVFHLANAPGLEQRLKG